jgi:hypothetical protein
MVPLLLYVATWAAQNYVEAKGLNTPANAPLFMSLAITAIVSLLIYSNYSRIKQKICKRTRKASQKLKQGHIPVRKVNNE